MNNDNKASRPGNDKSWGNTASAEGRRRDSEVVNVNLGPVENRIDVHTFIGNVTFN
ncbi:hypothetical protein SAMN05421805_119145 [Saccharopolyspora antimicrobica]|uniref:Uncharacterized protein n=1 Tax=Saccharopolyspora antimicrobica TaxID=455193 RepID=A0A1I5ISS3_9PSEU|nr:hypothetical protein [Saccharopolyspora antimicrobica]RKT84161.1 hypothetical protein ATL45_2466 [Saccharopolyspora antimicrobica]SFO63542.1 hypothetical protein SAMN05421805_119145 [Saccharopolyspora antimicrobica]